MAEEKCVRCNHDRRLHSRNGCEDMNPNNGKLCPCQVKYMQKDMFR